MNEEAKKVLEMIKSGKISVEDGEKLLDVIMGEEKDMKGAAPNKQKKILRIRVDAYGRENKDNARVNVNIPLPIARKLAGLTAVIPKEARKEMKDSGVDIDAIDLEGLIEMFESGEIDENLMDIDTGDEKKGARVKIYVE